MELTFDQSKIILLNADYQFLNIVTWKKAFALISKGKVQVLEYGNRVVKGAYESILVPTVIRLIKLVRMIYRNKIPFSKKNVLVRDGFKCAYCGNESDKLTVDHVLPRAKGGKSTFENCVAACKPCNNKKGHQTCQEARMFPKTNLVEPTISEFLQLKVKNLGVDKVLAELWNKI